MEGFSFNGQKVQRQDGSCLATGHRDGGFGREQSPNDLDTLADRQKVAEILHTPGYNTTDIAGVIHGNWLRMLRKQWEK